MIVRVTFGAGRKLVGRLADDPESGRIFFEYAPDWIHDGLELSPYHLPLALGSVPVAHHDPRFEGLFGLFRDSLPDVWGRLVLDALLRSAGLDPERLTPLERLTYVGSRGIGALCYEPERPLADSEIRRLRGIELAAMDREAAKLAAEHESGGQPQELLSLLQAGASAGGAKPKALIFLDDGGTSASLFERPGLQPWLVKLSSLPHGHKDSKQEGRVEYAYSLMARACGIEMPETRLFEIDTPKGRRGLFGARRFDRTGHGGRLHVHTVSGLRHIHHHDPGFSYETVADTLLRMTGDFREIGQLFRRAAFNVLAGNCDDHSKNFALILEENGRWRQSPAYDLTPSPGPGRQGTHVASLNGSPTPTGADLLAFGSGCGLPDAPGILEQVRSAIARWPEFADAAGLRSTLRHRVEENLLSAPATIKRRKAR